MDLFFFDFDNTLYSYDSMRRLPAQSRLSGVSQYHLASSWWTAGYERRAEAGEWPTAAEYLDKFASVTGARLSLDEWIEARREASTATPGVVDAFRRAASVGTACVLSNNPSPFVEGLPKLAPDVAQIAGSNVVVSCAMGVRKPREIIYRRALDQFGQKAADAFFVDDSAANVAGAASLGITAHHFTGPLEAAVPAPVAAMDRLLGRNS